MGRIVTTVTAVVSASGSIPATVGIPPLNPQPLSVSIVYAGNTWTFASNDAAAANLGNYTDPQQQFVQGCVAVRNAGLPHFTVFFRQDLAGAANRDEVVFAYGDATVATPADMGGYSVTISKAGVTLYSAAIPLHYWLADWRWQSAPRPVRTTAAALIAAKMLPSYGAGLDPNPVNAASYTYSPMTLAGIYPTMTITGERPDIGPVTEWQADYILAGYNLGTVLAQGDGAATVNWCVRSATGGVYDALGNASASFYNGQGSPQLHDTTPSIGGHPLNYDEGHEPAVSYLPFLLTGDPYFLEHLQFQVNRALLDNPPSGRYSQHGRYLAWPLRSAVEAAAVTPAVVPSWLNPQSYFQTIVQSYATWVAQVVANTDPTVQAFHYTATGSEGYPSQPGLSYIDSWQDSMLLWSLTFAVQLGFPAFANAASWLGQGLIARSNGTSGWKRVVTTPYEVSFQAGCYINGAVTASQGTISVLAVQNGTGLPIGFSNEATITIGAEQMTLLSGASTGTWTVARGVNGTKAATHGNGAAVYGPKLADWASVWSLNNMISPFPVVAGDPTQNAVLYTGSAGSVTYEAYTRGALAAMYEMDGDQAALACFQWLDQQMRAALSPNYRMDRKWQIVVP